MQMVDGAHAKLLAAQTDAEMVFQQVMQVRATEDAQVADMHTQLDQTLQQRDATQQQLQALQGQTEDAKAAVAAADTARDQTQQQLQQLQARVGDVSSICGAGLLSDFLACDISMSESAAISPVLEISESRSAHAATFCDFKPPGQGTEHKRRSFQIVR
jgi:hypothetical protein